MKLIITALTALAISSPAFAYFENTTMNQEGFDKGMQCMHQAWFDAEPTDEQTEQAKGFLNTAKETFKSNKSAIQEAGKKVMAAWAAHPIVKEEVAATAHAFKSVTSVVHHAFTGAVIDSINLLSADQRTAFNSSLIDCMHDGDDDHGDHKN